MNKKLSRAEERGISTVSNYVKLKNEYIQYPGRITKDGEFLINYKGYWIHKKKFDKLVKKPIVPNLTANINNPDKTKIWMHI